MLQLPYAFSLTFLLDIINCSMKFKKYIFSTYGPVKMIEVETRMILWSLTGYHFLSLNFRLTACLGCFSIAHLVGKDLLSLLLRMFFPIVPQQNCWVLCAVSMDVLKAWWEHLKVPSTCWQILEACFLMFLKHTLYFSKNSLSIFALLFELQLPAFFWY